ncbi:MAG: replication initiation protein, partial [Selenomonadaceae bacterium]|nr:replication initiation protein [Selenomonadaceae bacterium]
MNSKTKEEYYLANPLVRARRNYDMTGQRIFRLAIANLNPKLKNSEYYDEEFPTFHLSTDEVIAKFKGKTGNSHSIYDKLSVAAQNMVESSVRIGDIDSFIAFPVFDMIKFNSKDGLTVVFNRHMKPLLLNLEKGNYSRFYLQLAFELSSKYSLILLELILQFKGLQQYDKEKKCYVIERKLTPEELRFSLDVDEKKYKLTHDFIKYVIDPAIKEINKKTNYYIEPKYKIERGRYRKIKAFVFTMILPNADDEGQPKIKPKKENISAVNNTTVEDVPLLEIAPAEFPTIKTERQEEMPEPKARKRLEDFTKEEAYALARLLKFKVSEKVAFATCEKYGAKAINWAF